LGDQEFEENILNPRLKGQGAEKLLDGGKKLSGVLFLTIDTDLVKRP